MREKIGELMIQGTKVGSDGKVWTADDDDEDIAFFRQQAKKEAAREFKPKATPKMGKPFYSTCPQCDWRAIQSDLSFKRSVVETYYCPRCCPNKYDRLTWPGIRRKVQ